MKSTNTEMIKAFKTTAWSYFGNVLLYVGKGYLDMNVKVSTKRYLHNKTFRFISLSKEIFRIIFCLSFCSQDSGKGKSKVNLLLNCAISEENCGKIFCSLSYLLQQINVAIF